MHNMRNMQYAQYANMPDMQNKYFSIFLKKCRNMTYTPTGSRIPSGCSSFFSYFLKICKNRDPSTYFVKICEYMLAKYLFGLFRVKTYEPLWPCERLQESMAVAMVPRLVANSSTLCVACE
jgi:hypothetical protein